MLNEVKNEDGKSVSSVGDPAMSPEARQVRAHEIIRDHVLISMAAGLIPAPGIDLGAALANQLALLARLSKLYGVPYTENLGKSVVGSLMASSGGTFAGGALSLTLVKFVPFIGTAFGVIAMPTVLGAYTYALGKVFEAHFEDNGTLLSFNADRYRELWHKMLKRGKKEAASMKDQATAAPTAPAQAAR